MKKAFVIHSFFMLFAFFIHGQLWSQSTKHQKIEKIKPQKLANNDDIAESFENSIKAQAAVGLMQNIMQKGWYLDKTSILSWYDIGLVLKYVIDRSADEIIKAKKAAFDASMDSVKKQVREHPSLKKEYEKQMADLKREMEKDLDDLKIKTTAFSKAIEESIMTAIKSFLQQNLEAPESYISVVINAFNAGMKFWFLTGVTGPLASVILEKTWESIKASVQPPSYKWDWYPYIPLKSTSVTVVYCGPKDPYCLHGAKGLDIQEVGSAIKNQFINMVKSGTLFVGSTFTGIGVSYFASKSSKAIVSSLQSILGKIFEFSAVNGIALEQYVPRLLTSTVATSGIKKGIERYLDLKTIDEFKNSLMNIFDDLNIGLSDAEKAEIKKQFTLSTRVELAHRILPDLYARFLGDLQVAH